MNSDRFKFRAWDTKCKIMVYPNKIQHNVNTGLYIDNCYNPQDGRIYWPDDDDLILMQCTTLKDVNGKLIYEGDILHGFTHNNETEFKEPLKYSIQMGYYISNEDILEDEIIYDYRINFEKCKVIGNIYEGIQE